MPTKRKNLTELTIVHVEDKSIIAKGLEKVIKPNLESNLPDRLLKFVHVENKKQFNKIKRSIVHQYIIDLNLDGPKGVEEGIEILELLQKEKNLFGPIVYTASDNKKVKERCLSLGIDEDHFISKRNNKRDFDKIERLIDQQYQKYFSNESSVNIINETPSKKNPTTQPKHGYPADNQKLKQNKGTDTRNKILGSAVKQDKSEVSIPIPEKVAMNKEAQHISVYSDLSRWYKKMSQNAQIALCKFFLEPLHEGANTFGVEGKLFKSYMHKGIDAPEFDPTTKINLQLLINRNNRQLEKLSWSLGKNEVETVNFTTLDDIKQYFEAPSKSAHLSGFINDLIELFAAKRLAEFYKLSSQPKEQIVDLAASLNKGIGGLSFISNVWEYLTQEVTEDAEDTIELLKHLKEKGFDEIEEAFYCKIMDVDTKDKVVDTEIFSLEDNTNIFPRSFDLKLLKDAGLETVDACFKLLILTTSSNRKRVGGRTFFIEPLPLSAYYRMQSY